MRSLFGRIWSGFRGFPMWAQVPLGLVGGLFAVGLVSAPFTPQPASSSAPTTVESSSSSSSTTSSSTTSSSTTSSSTSTTTSTSTTVASTTTLPPTTAASPVTTVVRTTVPTTVATTAAVVRTTLAPATSCPNGTYVNTAGNEVCSPYNAPSPPTGATAQCVDGTYSFSQTRSGTCSGHKGVAVWL